MLLVCNIARITLADVGLWSGCNGCVANQIRWRYLVNRIQRNVSSSGIQVRQLCRMSPSLHAWKTVRQVSWRLGYLLPPVAVSCLTARFKNGLAIIAHCQAGRPATAKVSTNRRAHGEKRRLAALWSDLWLLIRPESVLLFLAVVAALMTAVINIQIPLLLGELINVVSSFESTSDIGVLRPHGLRLIAYYAVQSGLTFLYIVILSIAGENIGTRLRNQLFSSLITQDVAFFDCNRTGELMARLSGDVQEFKSSFKSCISQGLRAVTQIAGCAISLYIISPQMTFVAITVVPCVVALGALIGAGLRTMSFLAQQQVAAALMVAEEALSNVKTVRAFAAEDIEAKKFSTELDKAKTMNTSLGVGIGLFQGAVNMTLNVIVLGVIYGGSTLIIREEVSKGDIMSFLVTVQTIQRSLAHLSLLFGQAVRGISAASRVFEYVHMEPSIRLTGGKTIPFHSLMGEIEFRNVSFTYSSRPDQIVLDNCNLMVPCGKMVALVGASGAGKSTIASLLERFYDPQAGQVLLDGYDLKELDPRWLRGDAIGYISQEPVLFDGTIEENIRYGKPVASFLEVEEAAKQANAHGFIRFFPDGYSTRVGEKGSNLSGGQKQRIAIARALLKNPRIMILDEATSALDAESEQLVKDALNKAIEGRTVLIIAHRLSTVRNADLIAVVDHGGIAEIGTHDQLRRLKGIYNNLVRHQAGDQDQI